MATSSKTVQKWKISKLTQHPEQAAIFDDLPDKPLKPLADRMAKNGQREPVQIRPNGTIITGHQRVRAAKLLNWMEIDVVVRYDLEKEGEAAIEAHFLEDNLFGRQPTRLPRARCIKRLIESVGGGWGLDVWKKEEAQSKIAKLFNLSPRNVHLNMLVLDAPLDIQHLFDGGRISLVDAGRVGLLEKRDQQELVDRIANGEKPATVVAALSDSQDASH